MYKKNRNESIFIKSNSIKFKKFKSNNKRIFKKDYKSLFKFSLSSAILILFFFGLPVITNFMDENFKTNIEVSNISKKNFDLTLNNKDIFQKKNYSDEETRLENVYDDIDVFNSDSNNLNTSRLSASTIVQLFEDTKYDLKKVKETKLVNIGNSIDHLPLEMKKIENTQKRKNLFIQIVLPLIIEENTKIRLDRKKLFAILNKNNNSNSEREWLSEKFKQYGVKSNDFSTLKIRMDEIPASLAIAQAAKETGWGTSRFAREGNALFGQWTWSGEGIKPAGAEIGSKHKIAKFKVLKASVKAYQRNLNTHSGYKEFRKQRAIQRDNNGRLNSLKLVNFLDKYAETGIEYTKILKKIIEQNSLTEFDDVKILPTTKKLKNLI
ncbi:MAG: glucosaminidase domain-containing protein [Candidatus Pelagibacter sp.]